MSLKKLLVSALAALCAVSLLVPAAFAHGCHSRRSTAQTAAPYRCAVCTVEGCELAGRHYHGSTLYCGHNHPNGLCDGTCVSLCQVEGCTLAGRHYHNGTVYCGSNHSAGYCGGNCPYAPAQSPWGSRYSGGHHGTGHHGCW